MTSYSGKAQPFIDAIAASVFKDQAVRDWIVQGTHAEPDYSGARSLHLAQAKLRPGNKQPFYCNYWCGKDKKCTCRIPNSKSLETDAMFFIENDKNDRLAIHVEFKHPNEKLQFGQAEGYSLRAACWADRTKCPKRVLPHDHWLTVVFCGDSENDQAALAPFQRRISHSQARIMISDYPA